MAKTKVSDLIIFESNIKMGSRIRPVKFSNKILGFAEQFYEAKGKMISAEEILKSAVRLRVPGVTAVLFGALKVANEKYSITQFEKEFKIEDFTNYIDIICNGLNHFLPDGNNAHKQAKSPNTAAPGKQTATSSGITFN